MATPARLTLRGTISLTEPQVLSQHLQKVHARLVELGVKQTTVDLTDLEFLNSTGFKPLITWLLEVTQAPAAAQYKVTFVLANGRKWQRPAISSLACFAPDLVVIEAV